MTHEEIAEVKALAKERGHAVLYLRMDGTFCQPRRGTFEFIGPVSEEVRQEVSALLQRLIEEGRI